MKHGQAAAGPGARGRGGHPSPQVVSGREVGREAGSGPSVQPYDQMASSQVARWPVRPHSYAISANSWRRPKVGIPRGGPCRLGVPVL